MTITINLEPEKEARLRQKVAHTGRAAEQLVEYFVERGLDQLDAEEAITASAADEPTLAELFAGRTGLVNSEGHFSSSSRELGQSAEESSKRTLAEALAGRIGTQHSGRGDLSQNTGKAFARLLLEKHKADQE